MTYTFVLDESTIVLAFKGENERGETDYSAALLLLNISQKCHRIAVNPYIYGKYTEKLKKLESKKLNPFILKVITNITYDSTKYAWIQYSPRIHGENKIHDDDVPIARLAVRARGIFVTTDGRLKRGLENGNIIQKYGLNVMRPEEAINLAQQEDP